VQSPSPELQIRRAFLLFGALFGACYAVILPPLQAPDEFAHFSRAYGIAEGACIAPPITPVPLTIREMYDAFQPNMEQERLIDPDYIVAFLRKPLNDSRQDDTVKNQAADLYSCFPYVPAALGIEAGRLFGASAEGLLYLSRFANLLIYLVIVYLALRQLPGFHLPPLSLALMPMALSQAASASWDGVAYATGFFLFAYILKLAWDPHISTLEPQHYLTLGVVIVAASLCKTDVWLAPLLILVPASRFRSSRHKWAVLLGVLVLALVIISGWNYLDRANVTRWVEHIKEARQIYLSDNLTFIFQHPWVFLLACLRTWSGYGIGFAAQFVGRLGWLAVFLPSWTIVAYYLLLVFAALTDTSEIRMTTGYRLVCLGVVAVAVASVFIGMWCAETTQSHRDTVLHSGGFVPGVQGRYFIPFALPLLLAISGTPLRVNRKYLLAIAAVTVFTVNAVAIYDIRTTYYVTGDTGPYENKLIRRAGSTAEDGKVFLVRGGRRHWIIFGNWIEKHGYRWPDDLQVLTPEQFNAIPEGKVISEQ
jgi:uncharacterized membrane protein